jgi:hypothetical protein
MYRIHKGILVRNGVNLWRDSGIQLPRAEKKRLQGTLVGLISTIFTVTQAYIDKGIFKALQLEN